MADGFRTTVPEMQKAASDAETVATDLQSETQRLQSQLAPLFAVFKGQAATSYQQLQTRWDDASLRLTQALNEIAQGIRQNAGTYQAQDEAQAQSFGGISGALG